MPPFACIKAREILFIMSMHLELGFELNLVFIIIKNWYVYWKPKGYCARLLIKIHCLPTAVYNLLANLTTKFILCAGNDWNIQPCLQ